MVKVLSCVLCAMQVFTIVAFSQSADSSNSIKSNAINLRDTGHSVYNHLQLPGTDALFSVNRFPQLAVQSTSQIPPAKQGLSARSIVIPSAMIAYGAFTFTNRDLKRLNLAVRHKLWED